MKIKNTAKKTLYITLFFLGLFTACTSLASTLLLGGWQSEIDTPITLTLNTANAYTQEIGTSPKYYIHGTYTVGESTLHFYPSTMEKKENTTITSINDIPDEFKSSVFSGDITYDIKGTSLTLTIAGNTIRFKKIY